MQLHRKVLESGSYPDDHEEFYRELTARNRHFISPETQKKLRSLKILIAGCGSTGGACIEPLARLGVEHFRLADNGAYELNNLNRQHATLNDLNRNKALFHQAQLLRINPFIDVQADPSGITMMNVAKLVEWADIIMDAVDVTTPTAIAMKLSLHRHAHRAKKPVFTALDVGYCQWGQTYDYRNPKLAPLGGRLKMAARARHPMKALFSFVPLSAMPAHSLDLIRELFVDSSVPASQLGGTSDLLSGIIASAITRFAETGETVRGWNINLESLAISKAKRLKYALRAPFLRREIRKLLRKVE